MFAFQIIHTQNDLQDDAVQGESGEEKSFYQLVHFLRLGWRGRWASYWASSCWPASSSLSTCPPSTSCTVTATTLASLAGNRNTCLTLDTNMHVYFPNLLHPSTPTTIPVENNSEDRALVQAQQDRGPVQLQRPEHLWPNFWHSLQRSLHQPLQAGHPSDFSLPGISTPFCFH